MVSTYCEWIQWLSMTVDRALGEAGRGVTEHPDDALPLGQPSGLSFVLNAVNKFTGQAKSPIKSQLGQELAIAQ